MHSAGCSKCILCLLRSTYTCNRTEKIDIECLSNFCRITICNSRHFSEDAMVDYQSIDFAKSRYGEVDRFLTEREVRQVTRYYFNMLW